MACFQLKWLIQTRFSYWHHTYLFPGYHGASHHSSTLTQNRWQLSNQTIALQKSKGFLIHYWFWKCKAIRCERNQAHYLLNLLLPGFPLAGAADFLLIKPSCLKMQNSNVFNKFMHTPVLNKLLNEQNPFLLCGERKLLSLHGGAKRHRFPVISAIPLFKLVLILPFTVKGGK